MSGLSGGGVVETEDNCGSTVAYAGTATTSVASVPAVAGAVIGGVAIWNDGNVPLQVSFDGGTTFHDQSKKSFLSQNVHGEPTQIQVKTASSTAAYRMIINYEDV